MASPALLSECISSVRTAAQRWPVERGGNPAHQHSSPAESNWQPIWLILTRVPAAVVARAGMEGRPGKPLALGF